MTNNSPMTLHLCLQTKIAYISLKIKHVVVGINSYEMFLVKIMLANNQNDPFHQHVVLFGHTNKYVYIKQFFNNKKNPSIFLHRQKLHKSL